MISNIENILNKNDNLENISSELDTYIKKINGYLPVEDYVFLLRKSMSAFSIEHKDDIYECFLGSGMYTAIDTYCIVTICTNKEILIIFNKSFISGIYEVKRDEYKKITIFDNKDTTNNIFIDIRQPISIIKIFEGLTFIQCKDFVSNISNRMAEQLAINTMDICLCLEYKSEKFLISFNENEQSFSILNYITKDRIYTFGFNTSFTKDNYNEMLKILDK